MTKACLIVTVFCVCLLALFATLVYLISNINPPEISDIKYEDADYFFSQNEELSNQKIGYGLEKVTSVYDDYQSSENITRRKTFQKSTDKANSLPNEINNNCTKAQMNRFQKVTKSMNTTKDLRRSINEENLHEHNKEVPRSLLLEIKGLAGQPGIEIKLVAEKLKSKARRKYRNSRANTKSKAKMNYVELGSDNSIREASIVIAENGTFILNIYANSIDVIGTNENISNEVENVSKENKITISNISKVNHEMIAINSSPSSTKMTNTKKAVDSDMYTFNLMNNFTVTSSTKMLTSSLNPEKDKNIFTLINNKNSWEDIPQNSYQDTPITKVIDDILNIKMEEGIYTPENVVSMVDVYDNKSSSTSLVGLLIPEATATLPIGN